MYCKICGEHLYKELDIRVLFKPNYHICIKCDVYKDYDLKSEIIPIQNNIIEFVYILPNEVDINEENLFFFYGKVYIDLLTEKDDWSMVYWYDSNSYDELSSLEKYLFLKLSSEKILFLSVYPY